MIYDEFGDIESAKVIKDRFSGMLKGYGFIEMPGNSEANQAIKTLNRSRLDGNQIKVRQADSGHR